VTEFLPPNRQQKATEVVAVSVPSNIQFYARLYNTTHIAAAVDAACNQIATAINADMKVPGVSDMVINQEIDANNQVDYSIDVTVVSSDGNRFLTLTFPWNSIWPPGIDKQVAAAVTELDDLAPTP
jgi:hypothetical protein